jgi:ornithine decarboxylase
MTERVLRFLARERPETPCLVVDLDLCAENYSQIVTALPGASIYYAVKANPARPILERLHRMGARFDAASIHEIDLCLSVGINADKISFGNTIKKEADILAAYRHGVRLFAFDSLGELAKLARAAPGAQVFCRFLMSGEGADWPLSDKFGCDPDMAAELLLRAVGMGLDPVGVSFHVGSQQRDPGQWDVALEIAADIFEHVAGQGLQLTTVNIGGGFPSAYRGAVTSLDTHSGAIITAVKKHFGNHPPHIIAEPGRYIPGDAGIIQTEIVLISTKSADDKKRWVFLDIGKFGGLPEVMDEAIKYRIRTPYGDAESGPVIIAGPTCDEVDVIYKDAAYELPLALKVGDRIELLSTGAYTASYCSVGFNGFPPLREYYI